MSDFVNPLADPNLTWKSKILGVKDSVDCLVLEDVSCCDADGNVFENYSEIHVAKDIFRNDKGEQLRKNPYGHAVYAEKKGLFLPSFALTCNILEALYRGRSDPEVDKVLMQYKDHGGDSGWHAQNTVVDWKNRQVIHYPVDNDFPEHGRSENVNSRKSRISLGFKVEGLSDMLLGDALKKKEFKKYIMNLTGLKNPEVLIEIGKYFEKPARVWLPIDPKEANRTRAAWLGCGINDFDIIADGNLGSSYASRGVFER